MNISRSNVITIIILISILFITGLFVFNGSSGKNAGSVDLAETLQGTDSLPYTDLEGNAVDLAIYEGKTLVINAWASWCPFCVSELPDLEQLGKEYKDKNVVILAINRAESQNTAQAFVKYIGFPENITFLLDKEDKFYKSIGGFSMPETIFYKADGSIAVHKRGFMEIEEMRTNIETALTAPNN